MSKGSVRRKPRVSAEQLAKNWAAAFGPEKPVESARYRHHPETGELIPDYMWQQLGMGPKVAPRMHFVVRDTADYTSPVSGKLVSGRRQRRYDLQATGSRPYEGFASETTEANGFKAHQDRELDRAIEKSMPETLNDIKYQNNKPSNGGINWTWGL